MLNSYLNIGEFFMKEQITTLFETTEINGMTLQNR